MSVSSPLVHLSFNTDPWPELYRVGKPIQYAYVDHELELWEVQTAFAERPWSVEMPSAGRALSWAVLNALRERGIRFATLTHAAGISSLGSPAVDGLLPFPEPYEIPQATSRAIERAQRVIAVGTTVMRALEGSGGRPGRGVTTLKIDAAYHPRVIDGLLTGIHEPGTSHHRALEAFVPPALLEESDALARREGYVGHEFGDSMLVL
jgi:S-adenosylmethionine:tRNA ribosyltransferase-isomerase